MATPLHASLNCRAGQSERRASSSGPLSIEGHVSMVGMEVRATCRQPKERYYVRLYCIILYYTVLYYTILYYTILYYTILYYTILYYTILYSTLLNCIIYSILYTLYSILYTLYSILYTLYYTILYYTVPLCSRKDPRLVRMFSN